MQRYGRQDQCKASIHFIDNKWEDYREALRLIAIHDLASAGLPLSHEAVAYRSGEWHAKFMRENHRHIGLSLAAAQDKLREISPNKTGSFKLHELFLH